MKTKFKKNDNIIVKTGTDKGKRGKILFLDTENENAVVEGINRKKKFVKRSQENPKGGMINIEYPIHASNIALFCEKCKKGVRIAVDIKDNKKSRVCKLCGKSFE